MKSTDYPRMMFHRMLPPVTVNNEDEEVALGPEWSRIIQARAALPAEQKPAKRPQPEPEEEPMVPGGDEDEETEEKPDEQPQESASPLKPRRGRPPAPMSKQKRKA